MYSLLIGVLTGMPSWAKSDCADGEGNCWDCGKTENDLCTARLNTTTKELKITGTGEMKDYEYVWGQYTNYDPPPWGRNYTTLLIEGVKSIGAWAFTYSGITSVNIPDSVISIGNVAMSSCYHLVDIQIPDSVTTIGELAFSWTPYYETDKENFFIPESVTSIASDAFYDANIGTVYCAQTTPCQVPRDVELKTYETDQNGVYKADGAYYASPDDMMAKNSCGANADGGPSQKCINDALEHQVAKAGSMAGGALCQTQKECLKLIKMANQKEVCRSIADCKAYSVANNITIDPYYVKNQDGSYTIYDDNGKIIGFKGKRIYTIEEAEMLTKKTGNRFKIRYR